MAPHPSPLIAANMGTTRAGDRLRRASRQADPHLRSRAGAVGKTQPASARAMSAASLSGPEDERGLVPAVDVCATDDFLDEIVPLVASLRDATSARAMKCKDVLGLVDTANRLRRGVRVAKRRLEMLEAAAAASHANKPGADGAIKCKGERRQALCAHGEI